MFIPLSWKGTEKVQLTMVSDRKKVACGKTWKFTVNYSNFEIYSNFLLFTVKLPFHGNKETTVT